jgi:plasmid maintenance system killer protein
MEVSMTEDLLDLYSTGKSNRYKDVARNPVLLRGFLTAVDTMKMAKDINELKAFSRLHYEKLKYEYSGYSSVRLSNSYVHRLIFVEEEEGIRIELIEIDDTHYGNK